MNAFRALLLAGLGVLCIGIGLPLVGSTWIDPAGITAAGVALVVLAVPLRTSLDLLVVLAPFMFRVITPVGLLNLGTSDVLLPAVLVGLVARGVVERDPLRQRPPVVAGAVPILVAATVLVTGSLTVWSISDPDFLVSKAVSDTGKIAVGVVYLGLVVSLVRRLGRASAHRSIALWTWVATAIAAASVVGAVVGFDLVPNDGYRSLGFFADPNLYAGYLLVTLALLVLRTTRTSSPWLVVQALVLVAGLVTSGSRGGLATLVLLAMFTALMISSARLRLTLVGFAVLAASIGFLLLPEDDGSQGVLGVDRLLVSSAESGDDARFELWRLAISLWLEHPLFGIGLGQYPRFSVGIVGDLDTSELGHVVHNSFLSVLVSLGVVGLGIFLLMFAWVLHTLYAATGLTRNQQHALAGGVLVIAAQMMTLNLENLRYVWIYLGLVVGLAVATEAAPGPSGPERGTDHFASGTNGPVTRRSPAR